MNTIAITFTDGLISFLIGLLGSVLASYLFLKYILHYLRPNVQICNQIAIEADDEGVVWYWFKIINKSKYDGFDVRFRLEKRQMEPSNDGCYHVNFEEILFRKDSFAYIPKYHSDKEVSIKKIAPHAIQVRTRENLSEILKDKNYSLYFQVTLKHGLTGLSGSFECTYSKTKVIKNGSFAFGNQLLVE